MKHYPTWAECKELANEYLPSMKGNMAMYDGLKRAWVQPGYDPDYDQKIKLIIKLARV